MRRIILCDDEAYVRDQLMEYLYQAETILGEHFAVTVCSSGEELLELASNADIIFLDIQMGDLSGMDAARILRARNQNACLIFITSLVEYALEGYQVHAFGFLKKPVNFGTFLQQLEDALTSVKARHGVTLTFQNGSDIARIPSEEICYIEVMGHSVIVHCLNDIRRYPASLGPLAEQLGEYGFFRCHKSYLVHFKYVRRVLPAMALMADGSQVPISKHRHREFLTALACYKGGMV